MKLRWTYRARQDLKDIGRYIARDNRDAARKWLTRLRRSAARAAATPRAGRIVPEIGSSDVREVITGNYRLVYRIEGKTVTVLTVFEGHRLLRFPEALK
ncbi:MAG: type II toxin-antitoxin system RelE/ParE family toxin [Vicinamibacteria bacterium]